MQAKFRVKCPGEKYRPHEKQLIEILWKNNEAKFVFIGNNYKCRKRRILLFLRIELFHCFKQGWQVQENIIVGFFFLSIQIHYCSKKKLCRMKSGGADRPTTRSRFQNNLAVWLKPSLYYADYTQSGCVSLQQRKEGKKS